ncbi:Auxin response factor 15 [Hibiscus syriacus]|uniref:Auxin response factor n=1 Tax=Hibiscus syriacus TaxID=106335 RepID=A0A6A3BIX1_HIBSY|nr:auxin response factor 3-like [Hibiscus syriacus]KAE8716976.1 Auxin response factor 15 [Hibiscus syriacus]
MGCLIDLNTTEEDETPSSDSLSSSSVLSASGFSSSVCLELWHACAGPLVSLPKRGSVVVYFPQGHLEQFPEFSGYAPAYDLPPHVFCRVVDVKLLAEAVTDEVYAQVSLVPEFEQSEQKLQGKEEVDGDEEDFVAEIKSTTPHMFCKTLTASDTSTHGGFSVPRRAAEDCFPPLDYNQQRPSQELVAKDLHGIRWRFRHIFRGQPRRHLLTTGWSAFVNKKKLVSGDAVLFLRGEDGELRLGIRRAAQIKNDTTFPSLCSKQLSHSTFADVVHAVSMRSVFSIYYNPRASSSEFIVPVHKFWKSLDHSFSAGMRFKMWFETEDAAERRYTGLVTGISDLDPVRWPGSKWKCLLVRWDDVDANKHDRVSPWEIEPSDFIPSSNSLLSSGSKRNRVGLPSGFMVPDGIGASDFMEPLRFQRVLQGQEIWGFNPCYDSAASHNMHRSETRRSFHSSNGSGIAAIGNVGREPLVNPNISCKTVGFGESFQCHKVLQGQEIFLSSPYRKASIVEETRGNESPGVPSVGKLSGTRSGWSSSMQGYDTHSPIQPSAAFTQISSPSSVLMFQQASNPVPNFNLMHNFNDPENYHGVSSFCTPIKCTKLLVSSTGGHDSHGRDHVTMDSFCHSNDSAFRNKQELASSCRLFGFSLTEGSLDATKEDNMVQATFIIGPWNMERSSTRSLHQRLTQSKAIVLNIVSKTEHISMKQPLLQLVSNIKMPMVAEGCMRFYFKNLLVSRPKIENL